MAKRTVYTAGVLCRDADDLGRVVFFWRDDGGKATVALNHGLWLWQSGGCAPRIWSMDQWRENYTLKPPAPGKKFLCDVEL